MLYLRVYILYLESQHIIISYKFNMQSQIWNLSFSPSQDTSRNRQWTVLLCCIS